MYGGVCNLMYGGVCNLSQKLHVCVLPYTFLCDCDYLTEWKSISLLTVFMYADERYLCYSDIRSNLY